MARGSPTSCACARGTSRRDLDFPSRLPLSAPLALDGLHRYKTKRLCCVMREKSQGNFRHSRFVSKGSHRFRVLRFTILPRGRAHHFSISNDSSKTAALAMSLRLSHIHLTAQSSSLPSQMRRPTPKLWLVRSPISKFVWHRLVSIPLMRYRMNATSRSDCSSVRSMLRWA